MKIEKYSKEDIINHILKVEGGYVNDPSDSGGETNFGITVKEARKYGYEGSMKDLTKDLAFKIYEEKYWYKLKLNEVEIVYPLVAGKLMDIGVNMGTGRAAKFLQRCLNVLNNRGTYYADIVVDGDIGINTLKALGQYHMKRKEEGEEILYKMLVCLQGEFYISLAERREKDEKFLYGWIKNRI